MDSRLIEICESWILLNILWKHNASESVGHGVWQETGCCYAGSFLVYNCGLLSAAHMSSIPSHVAAVSPGNKFPASWKVWPPFHTHWASVSILCWEDPREIINQPACLLHSWGLCHKKCTEPNKWYNNRDFSFLQPPPLLRSEMPDWLLPKTLSQNCMRLSDYLTSLPSCLQMGKGIFPDLSPGLHSGPAG
jgi:hypothetical protein